MKKKNHRIDPPIPDKNRVGLPFEPRRTDWVEWVYDHRIALLVTTAVYLLLGFWVVTCRVAPGVTETREAFYVEVRQLEQLEQLEQLVQEKERLEQEVHRMQTLRQEERDYYHDIRNMISNQEGGQNAGRRDGRSGGQGSGGGDDVYEEARALEENLRASRQAYEEGVNEAAGILESGRAASAGRRTGNSGRAGGSTGEGDASARNGQASGTAAGAGSAAQKVSGPVSISYSLPGRYAVDLYRPTYQCRGGGTVTVNISVNRNGQVISAVIADGNASDPCLQEFAIRAAKSSRFNFDGTADNRQNGTITYVFAPQ